MKHGHSPRSGNSSTYNTWVGMKSRCQDPAHEKYPEYGGKGITVCVNWQKFENFLADMGERPFGKTLDRKEREKGYYKNNCRWITPTEQNFNQCLRKDNTSGIKGVRFIRGHWQARGTISKIEIQLYWGFNKEEAIQARKAWEVANNVRGS